MPTAFVFHPWLRFFRAGLAIAAVSLVVLTPRAGAQEIRGVVRTVADLAPVSAATIILLDGQDREQVRVVSDSSGLFGATLTRPGGYRLRVERMGFAAYVSEPVVVARGEIVRVELHIAEAAVPLSPIQVVSRRRDPHAPHADYYDRLDLYSRLGVGRFVTRDQIEARSASDLRQLLEFGMGLRYEFRRIRGIPVWLPVVPSGGRCIPAVFLDGVRTDWTQPDVSLLTASLLEGVEVYRGAAQAPGAYTDPTGCGVVLLWNQRGTSGSDFSNRRWTWRRVTAIGVIVAAILTLPAI
jgi:hypothetical protein